MAQPANALEAFVQAWGVVPREYAAARDLAPTIPLPFWSTLMTSMFLHGGWMHLGGNMLYLAIFGDNIERRLGSARFLAFYLLCGLAAAAGHILFALQSDVPTIGASGAISGVLGGYLVFFPRNRVRVLTSRGVVAMPAIVVLGFWILIQIVSQMGASFAPSGGGVAYMAHIAGFVAGIAIVHLLGRVPARRSALV
jgi:membrane associated rhomboid family serine protease